MKKILLLFLIFPIFVFGQLTPQFLSLKPVYTNFTVFNFNGSDQSWVVPTGVPQIFVDVIGAQGGSKGSVLGGLGGRIVANINVTDGETLLLMVGGQPINQNAVYGNGGNGGVNSTVSSLTNLAGGGMSGIFRTSVGIDNALIVAGGGGGAAGGKRGGNAGGTNGENIDLRSGRGGTQTAGGIPGDILDFQTVNPTAGQKGIGGSAGHTSVGTWNAGGGGGAGYFGGGGGVAGGAAFGSGGGGSSWANTSATTNIRNGGANNSGHGKIVIYW
jgi:hypothetical protein